MVNHSKRTFSGLFRIACILLLCLTCPLIVVAAEHPLEKMDIPADMDKAMEAYQNSDYKTARDLASQNQDHIIARLILHLSDVHDSTNQNYGTGLAGLKEIFEDEELNPWLRAEAALSYARTIQVFQVRERFLSEYGEVDVEKIFRDVIEWVPESKQACTAVMYISDQYLLGETTEERISKGFKILEDFIREYKGDQKNLVAVHLFLDPCYIDLRRNYEQSVKHLKRALELGISNSSSERAAVFRIARISDAVLGDKEQARQYYERFLKNYEYAREVPLVKNYLEELNAE
ncbi:MAG: tetratricopeptide repeat protein [Candidatus Sumerlaeia bacterium]